MAYLNKDERDDLLDKLNGKTFQQIRGIVNRSDDRTRLAYFRNVQEVGKWMTRYVMEGAGTQVTLVEEQRHNERKNRTEYVITEIIVEPTEENRL